MKRVFILFIMILTASRIFAITVEVEQVLDAPPSRFRYFNSDAAAYASNEKLLFKGSLAMNLFVLDDGGWVRLIKQYHTEQYNQIEQQERLRGINYLYNSTVTDEFLYYIQQRPLSPECYRVFVDDSGELQAEWVSEEYYDDHMISGLGLGFSLKNDYRVELTPLQDIGEGRAYWPDIVNIRGELIYRITEDFRKGFVEDTWTINTNPNQDRVAMVISFLPEKGSPYYNPAFRYIKKLVIFKINYDE